jgi:predicted AAA+ superfamily ATPase
MHRDAIAKLDLWKTSPNRKPLIIYGARQVGKTWLAQEFGRLRYDKVAYVLMADNPRMQGLFGGSNNASSLISALEAEVGFGISPDNTLIVLDEIQEIPIALSALKYFFEQTPEYHIIVAGSMLGIATHASASFPVGKVDSLTLHPLKFSEFLRAVKSEQLALLLENRDPSLLAAFHDSLIELLRQYFFIGGMPEAVRIFAEEGNYLKARAIQNQILDDYDRDFSKHAPLSVIPRIRMVWNSIPSQLARENKKFIYGTLKKGARAKEFELAIQWLVDAGLVSQIKRINKPGAPLKYYEDLSAFKLFMVDVGLLGALSRIEPRLVLEANDIITEFKGALTEQFVAQQLLAAGLPLYYYSSDDSKTAVDLVFEAAGQAIPLEVKSAGNLHSKSLTHFVNKHDIKRAIKLSTRTEKHSGPIHNEPLYLAEYSGNLV